jgi:hypothetical protein
MDEVIERLNKLIAEWENEDSMPCNTVYERGVGIGFKRAAEDLCDFIKTIKSEN